MLLYYAEDKEFDNIKRAIKEGAQVNAKNDVGYTALIYTCGMSWGIKPYLNIAKYLIDHGAKVNVKAKGGFTPLTEACAYGNYEIVKLLLESGADRSIKGQYGTTPLIFGATCSNWSKDALKIVKLLIKYGADINAVDEGSNNALLGIISRDRFKIEVAKYLIDCGIDLEHVGSFDGTSLTRAAEIRL